ncbi:MAG: hypothetical protein K0S61_4088, partial [Anaerocolumna sp.]|nr:hypothetical protein [Anaerocolumna sp.]
KYAGEVYDEETGLYYLRARYYDPALGRFINEDSVEGQVNNPLSLNLYTYCYNNPTKYIDPSGHIAIVPLLMKAGTNGAADFMLQFAMNYFFNSKTVGNIGSSISNVNWWQVSRSAVEGIIPWKTPGGQFGKAAATAIGDVLINALHNGKKYTAEQALEDFMVGFIGDLAGSGIDDLINKYGKSSVTAGLKKLGIDLQDSSKKYIGPDFNPKGKVVQEGINPNSLHPTKDLGTLDNQRMKNAVKYGGDKPIIVDRNGTVLDGHHRLKYAITNNKAVDISIGY